MGTAPALIKHGHTNGPECPVCNLDRVATCVADIVATLREAGSDDVGRQTARIVGAGLAAGLLFAAGQNHARAKALFGELRAQFLVELGTLRSFDPLHAAERHGR